MEDRDTTPDFDDLQDRLLQDRLVDEDKEMVVDVDEVCVSHIYAYMLCIAQ